MKFNLLTQAITALAFISNVMAMPTANTENIAELEKRDCGLELQWTENFIEQGLARYRVWLITHPRNDDLLRIYCEEFRAIALLANNPQCYWANDGKYVLDASYTRGTPGHESYRADHWSASRRFSDRTGCWCDVKV
ncbi:hypothetical protein B0I35DRAFT_415328 [Stachybotrys elegans]|uniref:Uncharacterized protein n=1 Tax=Stachybotrys elegans TaxID=80388 RepID=A0A8K0SFL3_9HYPO|nr:hypothetical protein B0I35DRAFT_415328 [Stachybotrys elegans]